MELSQDLVPLSDIQAVFGGWYAQQVFQEATLPVCGEVKFHIDCVH